MVTAKPTAEVRDRGCTHIKIAAFPRNYRSILFHRRMGFAPLGTDRDANRIQVVKDYWGPGFNYVVMVKPII